MKFLSLSLILLTYISCTVFSPRPEPKPENKPKGEVRRQNFFKGIKKRVAILTFFNESPYGGEDLANTVTNELKKGLEETKQFIMTSAGDNIFGSSKEIYAGGGVKLVQLSRRAKNAGVNLVIFGRIMDASIREKRDEMGLIRKTHTYASSKVEIRVFDINGNKEINASTLEGAIDDSQYNFFSGNAQARNRYRKELLEHGIGIVVQRAVPKIVVNANKLDWVGRVAKIIGNKIYINAGRLSGIQIGDILKAMTEGSKIYDPDTGALIGISKGEIKGTLEIVDFFGVDGATATLHSGGTVHEGDFVQLY